MRIASVILMLLLAISGCAVYTFSSSALGGVKTIAIPEFENRTTQFDIDVLTTEELNQAFVRDNTLKVMPLDQADAVLTGAITSYSHDPYTFDASEQVQEYIVRINLSVQVQRANSDKVFWKDDNLSDYGVYSVVDGETQDDGNRRAIQKLVDEILNRTVRGW